MNNNYYRRSQTRAAAVAGIGIDRRVQRKRAVEVEESATTEAAVIAALSGGDVGRLRAICIAEAETPHAMMWRRVDGRRRSDGAGHQLLSVTAGAWLLRKRPPLGER